jgi:hypothetical protein
MSRAVDSRNLKVAAMRAVNAGATTTNEIARKYQVSPHLLERWRGEWRGQRRFRAEWRGNSMMKLRGMTAWRSCRVRSWLMCFGLLYDRLEILFELRPLNDNETPMQALPHDTV